MPKEDVSKGFYSKFLPIFIAILAITSIILVAHPKLLQFSEITGMASWSQSTQKGFDNRTANFSLGRMYTKFVNTTVNSSGVISLNQTEIPSSYSNESMLLWMHFNEGSGTSADDASQYGNDGALAHMGAGGLSGWNSSGKFGTYGIGFDGTNDFVANSTNSAKLNFGAGAAFSYSAWVYRNRDGTDDWYAGMITKGNGSIGYDFTVYCRKYDAGGHDYVITVYAGGGESYTTVQIPYQEWTHIVVTRNAADGNFYVYKNGVLGWSGARNFATANDDYPLIVGFGGYDDSPQYWNGMMDEISIWNRTLSIDEITELYKKTKGTYVSEIKDLGYNANLYNFSWGQEEGAYNNNISFQVRVCNNSICGNTNWVGTNNITTAYFLNSSIGDGVMKANLTNMSGRYFQYKAYFARNDTNINLKNFTVNYDYIDLTVPYLNITYPINGSTYGGSGFSTLNLNWTRDEQLSGAWYSLNNKDNLSIVNWTTAVVGVLTSALDAKPADLDSDGYMDIIAISNRGTTGTRGLIRFENNHAGGFNPVTIDSTARTCVKGSGVTAEHSIKVIDFDLDGNMDVIIFNCTLNAGAPAAGSYPIFYKNNGSMNFSIIPLNDTQVYSAANIFATDFDLDGDLDLVYSSASELGWYKNNGSMNFTNITIAAGAGFAVNPIDIDNDGDIDVGYTISNQGGIYWYKNNGAMSFTQQTVRSDAGQNYVSVRTIDFDKDGDIDFLMDISGVNVYYEQNNGLQSFARTILNSSGTNSFDIADIDNNGYLDFVGGAYWLENNGSQNFTNKGHSIDSTLSGTWSGFSVKTADIDKDSDLDIVATTGTANQEVVWEKASQINITLTSGWQEGLNNVTIYAKDSYGNLNKTTNYFYIDTTPPYITINLPAASPNNYTNSTPTINASIAETGCLWYNVNSSNTNISTCCNCTNFSVTLSAFDSDGFKNITFYANDSLNNINSSVYYFTVDTVQPFINFTDPTPANNTHFPGNFTYVNTTATDANLGSAFIDWNRSLIGYWSFDQNEVSSTTAYDNSTWGNNGTCSGTACPTWTSAGKIGGAYDFDGLNDYISISDSASLNFVNNFTIGFWVKFLSAPPAYSALIGQWPSSGSTKGFLVLTNLGGDNKIYFFWTTIGSDEQNIPLNWLPSSNLNAWKHLVFVKSGRNLSLYVDGNYTDSGTVSATLYNSPLPLTISAYSDGTYNINMFLDEVMIFNRVLSAKEINATYDAGTYRLENNFTSLVDGDYTYQAWAIDKAGNINKTEIRELNIGPTTPVVTLNSPLNNSYNSSSAIGFNCSAISGTIGNITLYINSTGTFDINKTNGTTNIGSDGSVNFTIDNLADGSYIWNCLANNSYGFSAFASANRTFIVDTVQPYINFTAPTYANNSNLSHSSINVTINVSDSNYANVTFGLYNNSCNSRVNMTNFSFSDFGLVTSINWTNLDNGSLAEGEYCYNVTVYDKAGNKNSTENRTITLDRTMPHLQNMTNLSTEYTSYELDPLLNFTIIVNVSDRLTGLKEVVLQYNKSRNHDGVWIGWENITMQNLTGSSIGDYWNASLNITTNGTWKYRIYSKDFAGNINTTWNESFDAQYDCSWHSNDTISDTSIGTINQVKEIGNITVFNDGDYDYSAVSHCSLAFSLKGSGVSSDRIAFNDSTTSGYLSKTIAAASSYTTNTSATFDSSTNTENLIITITESAGITSLSLNTSNTTLTTYAGGPYLDLVINKTQATMNQTAGINYIFEAYVKNIGNSSAYNVTLNWTLPTGWTNVSGLLQNKMNIVNCSDPTISPNSGCTTDSEYHLLHSKLTVNIATPETASSIGTVVVYANSSANDSLLNKSRSTSVNLICHGPSTSDGCGSGCTYDSTETNYDGDCLAPSTTTVTTTTGGGGGGGGETIKTESTYELVRGKDNSFIFNVKNSYTDAEMQSVKVRVSGFLSQYMKVEPDIVNSIPANSSYDFNVKITAPAYFEVGKYTLTFTVNSYKRKGASIEAKQEDRYITLYISELSKEGAMQIISDSEKLIEDLKNLNLSTSQIESILKDADDALNNNDYEELTKLGEEIKKTGEEAINAFNVVQEYEQRIIDARNKGIDTPKTERLLELAKSAMQRGEYTLAMERAKDIEMVYALETKGEFNLVYYVTQNTFEAFFITLIALSMLVVLFFKAKLTLINHELKGLGEEEEILVGLMKTVQHECFTEKKLSMGEYYQTMSQYEEELSKNIQRTIMFESSKTNLFKFKKQRLELERNRIMDMMKKTQADYMKEGTIDTRVYTNKMHSFSTRLSEVEESLALHDAEKEIRSDKIKRFLKFLSFIKGKGKAGEKKRLEKKFIAIAEKEVETKNKEKEKLEKKFLKIAEKEEQKRLKKPGFFNKLLGKAKK